MKIDNFMLTNWQTCPAKYKLSIVDHWQPKMKSAALGFGAVIHEGLAEWYRGTMAGLGVHARLEAAVEKIKEKWPPDHPVDDFRNLNNAERLMRAYATEYPGENFKILQVEVPFTLDLERKLNWCPNCLQFSVDDWLERSDVCMHCNSDLEWIEYGGIQDTITEFSPVLYTLEHKTTSQMGPLYFRQFETSNQITGYCWALGKLSGRRVGGANINGMCLTTGGRITLKRETTNRNEQDYERWKGYVQSECNAIKRCEITGVWPYRTEQCLGKYGLCAYHGVHTLSTDIEQRRALEAFYEQREWNHELRDAQQAEA